MEKRILKKRILFPVLVLLLVISVLAGLALGSAKISVLDVFNALTGNDAGDKNAVIIRAVRLPRVIGGLLAGSGLGCAGVILQTVMNNSLASPNTIGVNSGAGFFVMLSMVIVPGNLFLKSFMAFTGALIASLVILGLAFISERSRMTIVLAGITISGFLSAGMNMIKTLDTDVSVNATQFLIGSLSGVTLKGITLPLIGIVICVVITIVLAKALNILSLGDGVANSLGLNVNLFRFLFVVLASILSGLVVSFAGLVGFVGLIVPHITRRLFGQDARILIPASTLLGAVFVILADLISRTVFMPYELPVGIILSLAGGPFFLYLLMRRGGRRVNA